MTRSSGENRFRDEAGARIHALPSRLDAQLEETLIRDAEEALRAGRRLLVLDFSSVSFASSAGIGVLVDLLRRAASKDARLVFAAVQGQPLLVLRRVGLDRIAPMVDSVYSALHGETAT